MNITVTPKQINMPAGLECPYQTVSSVVIFLKRCLDLHKLALHNRKTLIFTQYGYNKI